MSLKKSMLAQIPATRLQVFFRILFPFQSHRKVTHLLYSCPSMSEVAAQVSDKCSGPPPIFCLSLTSQTMTSFARGSLNGIALKITFLTSLY